MDPELEKRLRAQDRKLEEIYFAVNKIRKYFKIILWITVLAVVVPLIGLTFAIPAFMKSYLGAFEGLL